MSEFKQPNWTAEAAAGTSEANSRAAIDAARACDAVALSAALLAHAPINGRDQNGMTALHHAAARGSHDCVQVLLADPKCDTLIPDNEGRYPFELAIEGARDYRLAERIQDRQAAQAAERNVPAYMLRNTADPKAKDKGGEVGNAKPIAPAVPSGGRGRS